MKNLLILVTAFLVPLGAYASSCGAIQNKDRRNFCYANTKGNPGLCGAINNRDYRNYCYAVIKGQKGLCGAIQNRDFRSECYANF